jgi:hypothetical protein
MSCPRVIKVCGIGLVGPAGKSILSGNGAPTVAVGTNGEFYIDLTASRLYGPKMSGAWGAGTLLKGDKGDKGDQGDPATYSNATPQPLGVTASAGDDQAASRADHVHARPTAAEVGADASGTAVAAVAAHVAAADPHPGYLTAAEGNAAYATAAQGAKADTAVQPAALSAKADLVNGLVPSSQLPGFVDDVIEGANLAAFPATGESGKLYVALDTGKTYRWSGSAYVEISASPGSTDAVPEGANNLYHTTQRAAAAAPVQSVAGKTGTVTLAKGDVGLGDVDNTSDANKPISSATQTALDGTAAGDDARIVNSMRVVTHGTTANTARPAGAAAVYWIGTVEPTNAANNDLWIGGL